MAESSEHPSAETRSRERTRERLIEAAFEVFAEQGVAAPSVEAIVERAGFTRGAFYSNFDSKVELFFAIADDQLARAMAELSADVEAALTELLPLGTPITPDAVREVVVRVLTMTAKKPRTWTLFDAEFEVLALRDPKIAQRYATQQETAVGGFARLLGAALDRIRVRFVLPEVQATRMLLAAYSASMRAYLLTHGTEGEIPTEALEDVSALAYVLTERLPADV